MSDNRNTMPAWDSFDAYLFDIDGTLLHCTDAVHYHGFCRALTEVAGHPMNLDGVVTHGNVDPGILRDAMAQAQVPENIWRPRLANMQETICRHVEAHAEEFRIDILPAVREVLDLLNARGALLGVATGNLERVGWAKLHACGLAPAFTFGGFSDTCESRAEVFAKAALKARALLDNSSAKLCVFGDTPADIDAARANELTVIAVATGIYSRADLESRGPDRVISSMTELMLEVTG